MEPFFAEYLKPLRDVHKLFIETFEDLPTEALDWVPGDEMNSFCVLVVHTTGSAQWWMGIAAGDPPERNRDLEFQARGLSVEAMKARFAALETYASAALEEISLADLTVMRTVPGRSGADREVSAGWALMHVLEHTGLHLGHAQITRQLWERR